MALAVGAGLSVYPVLLLWTHWTSTRKCFSIYTSHSFGSLFYLENGWASAQGWYAGFNRFFPEIQTGGLGLINRFRTGFWSADLSHSGSGFSIVQAMPNTDLL